MKAAGRLILLLGILTGLGGCGDRQPSTLQASGDRSTPAKTYQKVRGMAVAEPRLFYPRHPETLAKMVDDFLADAKPEPVENLLVRGLVCPHAGYRFSGKTAALGYKLLAGRKVDTVIVMAPSHYAAFQGASIPDVEAYETPLGMIPLSPMAAELAKLKPFVVNPPCQVQRPGWWKIAPKELPPFGEDTPHSWEHSLEVQLPFLQRTLKDFSLVPIVFGQQVDPEVAARSLEKLLDQNDENDENTILVASSDLSHVDYHPTAVPNPYEKAKRLDRTCIEAICSLKTAAMQRQHACGKVPILTLMHIARHKGWKAKVLDYRNTYDVTGDRSRVVGYTAIAFYDPGSKSQVEKGPVEKGPAEKDPVEKGSNGTGQGQFTPKQQQFLLQLARDTVNGVVNDRTSAELDPNDLPAEFTEQKGCFVTLKKNGQLRGCIGNIFPQQPLYLAVIHMARGAAVADRRFSAVRPDELDEIEVEVSVLTVPELLEFQSPEELLAKLRPHRDGVVFRLGYRESTFLPQVWDDLPDKRQFLSRLAQKARLAADAWKDPLATFLIYRVEAFKESER